MTLAEHIPITSGRLVVPKAPVIVMEGSDFVCLTLDGEFKKITAHEAKEIIALHMPIVCNGPHVARMLHIPRFHCYDVLELFAFIHPGKFAVPTPRGLTRQLHLLEPDNAEDQCLSLRDCIRHLLNDLMMPELPEKSDPAALAAMMGLLNTPSGHTSDAGWPWTPVVLTALGRMENPPLRSEIKTALKIWDRLPEWSIHAPPPPAGHMGITEKETDKRLSDLLHTHHKEERPQQQEYARALSHAFAPRQENNTANIIMAEAGTGVGKTLGYLAPATLWAEKNEGSVWISTYTRNLQRQIDNELHQLYEDPATKDQKVVTRKGRENYLCLLNLEDATQSPNIYNNDLSATALGLMIRWASVTHDGDLAGQDFPGWMTGLLGWPRVTHFADRKGECIYSACPHFDKCFVEKSIRKAKRADIVIANHALIMHQTAVSGEDDILPSRYVFDEAHHLFDAADSAFCAHLNGQETADLRRWLLGVETQKKSRARGIKKRLEDLIAGDDEAMTEVEILLHAARSLPGPNWRERLSVDNPKGMTERFLLLCRNQVVARHSDGQENSYYSLETDVHPPIDGLFEAAYSLSLRFQDLKRPMKTLIRILQEKLSDDADPLDTATRERIHFMITSLTRRSEHVVGAWIEMLKHLQKPKQEYGLDHMGYVDWLEIARVEGRDIDIGFYRYAIDPAQIFATHLKPHVQGAVMTSATLRDITNDDENGWQTPKQRASIQTLAHDATFKTTHVASPFDYTNQTKIIVIKDVDKNNIEDVANAMNHLFTATGGGALGIFTAIQRLKAVAHRLLPKLAMHNIPLLAQHVDPLDTGTLIDIFKEEENACLLGTDATRDGIDVPGRSLRLVVYDRVPWPRPSILHKARRNHFGRGYDDMLTRFKLKQAFGRLIRTQNDKGVFVMLDAALPTRLTTAFPEGVDIHRIGLKDAILMIKEFLKED